MTVDAQLKVLNELGALVGLVHVDDVTSASGRSAPVADGDARAALAAILAELGTKLDAGGTVTLDRELTERMFAKAPASSYTLWLDTANASHIYTLEAPTGTAPSGTGFRGIRITLDVLGNPVGAVETNVSATLTFDNRTTDPGWAT